jgi:HlyD family secretion protein
MANEEPKTPAKPEAKKQDNQPRRRLFWVFLVIVSVAIVGGLVWWFTRAPAVAAIKVQWSPLVRTLQFSARVATTSRVEVGSTITGRARIVSFKEGDLVKKDDVLVQLEDDELRAVLLQAKAAEKQAIERLVGLQTTGRRVVEAAVTQADSAVLKSQAELLRTQELAAKGFLSQTRLDDALNNSIVAQAQRAGATAQSAANRGTDLLQAREQVALLRGASEAANARLAQVVVIAPSDAMVLTRLVEPGQIVQPGRALFSLALKGPTVLVAQVDERYLEQLKKGQVASVVADAFPNQRFAASVQLIAPLVDAQRGAVQVKLSVTQDPPEFLREDRTLSVEVETAKRDRSLIVPVEVLRGDESSPEASVLIELNGRAEQRTVRLGIRTLKSAEVLSGLKEGDVVLKGAAIKAGSRVRSIFTDNAVAK